MLADVLPSLRSGALCGPTCLWAASFLAGLGGCSVDWSAPSRITSSAEDLPILWERSGTYSRLTRSARIVARDQATLAQVPIAEVPVDFDQQMLLICGLGPTPENQLGVRIARVWRQGTKIRVQERRIHPGVDNPSGIDPASPWTIVVVPRSDLNVEGYSATVPKGLLGEHPGAR